VKQFRRIFLFLLIITGCSSDDEPTIDVGKSYVPLRVGNFQIYEIDQITYSPLEEPEELHYQLKTEVVDSFEHNAGGYGYVIRRSLRDSESDSWTYDESWSVRVNDLEAVVNESNTSFVKIAFPVVVGKRWNGNAYNSSDADEYELTIVNQPYEIGDMQFENTIVVDQENRVDLLFNDRRFEVYAKDIGLIYSEITDLEYCSEVDCFGQNKIEQGIVYKQTIIDHGSK
jgi:hypothetical protein